MNITLSVLFHTECVCSMKIIYLTQLRIDVRKPKNMTTMMHQKAQAEDCFTFVEIRPHKYTKTANTPDSQRHRNKATVMCDFVSSDIFMVIHGMDVKFLSDYT